MKQQNITPQSVQEDKKIKPFSSKTNAEIYLEYVNDWLTIEKMAENYGRSVDFMKHKVEIGKIEYNESLPKEESRYTHGVLSAHPHSYNVLEVKRGDDWTKNICTLEHFCIEEKEVRANAARIVECWNGYDKLKAENEKVKRLLHDLTPGGSEFYNDPEYCAKTIREMRESNHYTLSNIVKETKAENEALKEANKELLDILKELVYVTGFTYKAAPALSKAKKAISNHSK
jgi:hypothetical protein